MKQRLYSEWENILLLSKSSPYLFRTRLERVLNHTTKYAEEISNNQLIESCNCIFNKLKYISDQSNQTSEGCLNSFLVLEDDMIAIKNIIAGN